LDKRSRTRAATQVNRTRACTRSSPTEKEAGSYPGFLRIYPSKFPAYNADLQRRYQRIDRGHAFQLPHDVPVIFPLPATAINNAQTAIMVWQQRSNAHDVTLNQALSCCCSSRCFFKGRGCSHLIQGKTNGDSKVCTQRCRCSPGFFRVVLV